MSVREAEAGTNLHSHERFMMDKDFSFAAKDWLAFFGGEEKGGTACSWGMIDSHGPRARKMMAATSYLIAGIADGYPKDMHDSVADERRFKLSK